MDGMALPDATPPEPRALTQDEATSLHMALCARVVPNDPLPACPDCTVQPHELTQSPSLVSAVLRIAFQPCGHTFTVTDNVLMAAEPATSLVVLSEVTPGRAQIPHPRREQPPTAAAQVAQFAAQAAELRRLRTELARSRRRECNQACDEVGYERDRLAGELEHTRVGLVGLGQDVNHWAELSRRHQRSSLRYFAAWKSARRRSRQRTDERDAWKALYEAGDDAERLQALTARVAELHGALRDVLERFHPETLGNGFACMRSENVGVDTVEKWRAILRQPTTDATARAVRGAQGFMALDLHRALGQPNDPKAQHQGHASWADWWAQLLSDVRKSRQARYGLPAVQGRCPACHRESLFLGDGGYVTCRRLECTDPEAATKLLERDPTANPEA